MTDQSEPEDTCRPVEIDGETIRVRGASKLSSEGHEALAAIVRAAKAKTAAEPPPVRQQLRAHAFNAVAPALKRHDEWLRLTVRRSIADAVLAAIENYLDIGEAEAWCKTCRRVWDGKGHQCAGDTEAAVQHVITLYEQWVKAGPPPLGTSLARWWDTRLIELHDAILPPTNHTTEQPCTTASTPQKSPAPSLPDGTPTP